MSESTLTSSAFVMEDHVNMLIDKINMQELDDGAVFQIDSSNLEEDLEKIIKQEKEYYPGKQFAENIEHMPSSILDDVIDLRGAPGSTDFKTISSKMSPVTKDSRVLKRVLRQGNGPIVTPTSMVEVHYSGYYEFGDEPFDSSYLRGQTHKFVLSMHDCIPGLYFGMISMQKGEIAHFLVPPELGYGVMGVPPRIPPNAELLFEVEIINFIDGVEAKTVDELNNEEDKDIDVMKLANAKYLEGNDLFKKRNLTDAIVKYRKALSLIEVQNDLQCDEEKRRHLILTLCTNLALCHNKKNNYQQACKMCQRALAIKPNHCKALFYFGRALLMRSDFDAAKVQLLKAQRVEPTNKEINREISLLEEKQRAYTTFSKNISSRMFTSSKSDGSDEPKNEPQKSKWSTYLTAFVNDEKSTTLALPSTMTVEELKIIQTEAKNLNLIVIKAAEKIIIKKQD